MASEWRLILAALIAGAAVFSGIYGRASPVHILDSWTTTPQVPLGGFFHIERRVEWLRWACLWASTTATAYDSLSPPKPHPLGTVPIGLAANAVDTRSEWQIPFTMALGEATYQAVYKMYCFPFYGLWPIEVEAPPVKFEVVK